MSNPKWGVAAVAVFVAVTVATLTAWEVADRNPVNGDEPHYLVMADSLVSDRSLEVTEAYRREYRERRIYESGLAAADATPNAEDPHLEQSSNGVYSVHSYGLPLLLALPFALGGTYLAKLAMVAFVAVGAWFAWGMSRFHDGSAMQRALALGVVLVGANFVTSSTQLYPDLPTGVLTLAGLAAIQRLEVGRGDDQPTGWRHHPAVAVGLVAAMPWLHIKTAATAVLLSVVIGALAWRRSRDVGRSVLTLAPLAISGALLAAYNAIAFGQLSGPYSDGALSFGAMPLTVFFGLYVDQFHGMFVQNPALIVALFAAMPFIRRFPITGCALLVTHLSLVVPNALHPAWYGGFSFAGRFGVAGAFVLTPIAVYGISEALARRRTIVPLVLVSLAASFHAVQFVRYGLLGRDLYRNLLAFPTAYPSYVPAGREWLPMFYQSEWAFEFGPNRAAIVLCFGLLVISTWMAVSRSRRDWFGTASLGFGAAVLSLGAVMSSLPDLVFRIPAAGLPTVNGDLDGRVVNADGTQGVVTFGPFIRVGEGVYRFQVRYRSPGDGEQVGEFIVTAQDADGGLAAGTLESGSGDLIAGLDFEVTDDVAGSSFELLTFSDGDAPLAILEVIVDDVPSDDP